MVFATRALPTLLVLLLAAASCDDAPNAGGCCSEDEFVARQRTDFARFTRGHSYFVDVEPGFECVAATPITAAYPGIDASAVYTSVSSGIVTSTAWSSPGAP